MAESYEDSSDVERLYEYGERLNESKDKSQHASDYEAILKLAKEGSIKVKQLSAQLIPKFFKFFPSFSQDALDRQFDLCIDEELGVRVQAIRGLPLFCKDNPEHLSKIVDVLGQLLGQLLPAGENVERDAVHKALMTLLRQDIKRKGGWWLWWMLDFPASGGKMARELCVYGNGNAIDGEWCGDQKRLNAFLVAMIRWQENFVFMANGNAIGASLTVLFKYIGNPDEPSIEESIREKVLCFIRDKVFPLKAELLKPQEQMERHITDLVKKSLQDVTGAEFKMFIDFLRSLSLFGQNAPVERVQELVEIIEGQADLDAQFNVADGDHIDRLISCLHMALPFFMLPEERKVDLLKNLAECSSYVTPQDSRQLLPSIVQLLKTPNATNSLCGYKIVTGQPSDRLGEDFSENHKDFTERLRTIDDLSKAMVKKLTQGMAEQNKLMAAAKTDGEKDIIPLHSKSPSFIGDQKIKLSWKEAVKPPVPSTAPAAGTKRAVTAATDSSTYAVKKGRGTGGVQNQLVNRALDGLYHGGRTSGRGRGWGGRGRRGRGFR
ncbi:apoptosis inhibitory protein 5 [Actinidia rufa]|uniref:Apoptosis inhibitory protein 5 n=1 Tax=Actinidia rufa TaxID=165716 RepID=A0A7J0GNQ0_9ERIC|nr:apoptosis inhibitory protein 5 [Actinidia rufa]